MYRKLHINEKGVVVKDIWKHYGMGKIEKPKKMDTIYAHPNVAK